MGLTLLGFQHRPGHRLACCGRRKASATLVLLSCAAPIAAQILNTPDADAPVCSAHDTLNFRGLTARLENDLFADTDQNYTNGVAFIAVSHDMVGKLKPECLPASVRLHAQLIKYLNPGFWAGADNPAHAKNVVVKFGQAMFTPKDFARTDLITDDRPYAGLLYVGMPWNHRKHEAQSEIEILDTREMTLGVIGPLALAKQTQNIIHNIKAVDKFEG